MTAPTSDRAQHPVTIRYAIEILWLSQALETKQSDTAEQIALLCDKMITERLGGGEREAKDERDALKLIADTLNEVAPGWLIMSDAIRTLAQTAKDATARAEAAERANVEVDNARKAAEQSARDLRAENVHLRAQLDAMTGEQPRPSAAYIHGWGWWQEGDAYSLATVVAHAVKMGCTGAFTSYYRHPSPAARVVGACVVKDGKVVDTWFSTRIDSGEAGARHMANMMGGVACMVTELPALTPNADGQTARVDEVSDTANGLRHVARGPNSPQGAVAYGRTAKDATQLLDTIRQHKSTPNADGAK